MNCFFISKTPLFEGIKEDDIKNILKCLSAKERKFKKGEIILYAGDEVSNIGIVESGSVNIVINFYHGYSQILGHVEKGEMFAENYAAIPHKKLICDAVASENSEILFINFDKLINLCDENCTYHRRLLNNLLKIFAQKSLNLSSRMLHTGSWRLKDRIISYLTEQAIVNDKLEFYIPFNRQELSDYLGVNRSALSAELSKLKKSGIIDYKKNYFKLNSEYFNQR